MHHSYRRPIERDHLVGHDIGHVGRPEPLMSARSCHTGEMGALLVTLLRLVSLLLIARAILSWVTPGPDSPFRPIADFVYQATEPILAPVRRVIPPMGGLDISFIVVILGINVILIPIARSL